MYNELITVTEKVFHSINSLDNYFKKSQFVVTDRKLEIVITNIYSKNRFINTDITTSLSGKNIGVNAFSLASLRKTTAVTTQNNAEHYLIVPAFSIASPIFNFRDELIGFVGIFSNEVKNKESLIIIMEAMSKLIATEVYFSYIDTIKAKFHKELNTESPHDDEPNKEFLNEKEKKLIELISSGLKDEEIARLMHVSVPTVRSYISKLFYKFNINSKVQLVDLYYKKKISYLLEELTLKND